MRVLIVGCGYVGMALGRSFAQQGHEVSGLRRPGPTEGLLRQAGIEPVLADITELSQLQRLPADYDWVVNSVSASGGGLAAYRSVYLKGMSNLLSWLGSARLTKFVYTSSTGVYAQEDGSLITEQSPATGSGETGQVLVETEQTLFRAVRETHFPGVLLRVSGIYGPDRGYWLKQFLSGQARMEGDGTRWLNMIHQQDVVGAIRAALERGTPGEVYNVSDDEPVTQRALFEWLAKELNRPIPPALEEAPSPRKRGMSNKRIDNRRLKTELGYKLLYPTFREGFRREIDGSLASQLGRTT